MSKAMITNSDSIDETPPSAKDRILSLNREVVGCRVCLRLANYRESGGQGQEEAISQLELLGQTCPRFRRHQGYDSRGRTSSSTSRRESDWKSVHRG